MVLSVKDFAASLKGLSAAELKQLSTALTASVSPQSDTKAVKVDTTQQTAANTVVKEKQAEKVGTVNKVSKLDVDYSKSVDLFDIIYSRIVDSEGGKVDDKSDLGGATMYGISSRSHPELAGKIKAGTLTLAEAKAYTKAYYFDVQPYINEVDPGIAYLIVDSDFHGNKEVVEQLQLGFNKLLGAKYGTSLKPDGDYGSTTGRAFALINSEEARKLIEFFGGRKAQIAREAADRVIAAQKAKGVPVKDYFDGYLKRNEDRYANSIQIREQVA